MMPAMTVDVLGLVGSTIDQIRFDACVDAGGFGLVYRGVHLGIEETVAIKCLRVSPLHDTSLATARGPFFGEPVL